MERPSRSFDEVASRGDPVRSHWLRKCPELSFATLEASREAPVISEVARSFRRVTEERAGCFW